MAKIQIPPTKTVCSCCGCKNKLSESPWWPNKETGTWWLYGNDSEIPFSGYPSKTLPLSNISQQNLDPIVTADAIDLPSALALLNELKAKYNLDVILTNAIKESQNTELTNQRAAGQQSL